MARIVESKNPGMRCSILLTDRDGETITVGAGPSLPAEYNAAVEGLRIGPAVGSCGTAAFWNVPVVVENIGKDPLWSDLRGAAELAGVQACWSQPIPAEDGSPLGAMALYHDTPLAPSPSQMHGLELAARMVGLAVERERLETQLLQTAKLEALGVLAGGIAHDFNNLLSVILGNVDLATEMLPADARARALLREAATASSNAAELCNQLLSYAGKQATRIENLDVNEVVRELRPLLRVLVSKRIDLDVEVHDAALGIRCDRSELSQILMNLVTNAAEAIGDDAGTIRLRTNPKQLSRADLRRLGTPPEIRPGSYLEIRVSDTGCGMDEDTRAHIFDPFFTTKPSGRGLGLATVRAIVHRYSGMLEIESTKGMGTTFNVRLPCTALRTSRASDAVTPDPVADGPTVLVVDDEAQIRTTLSRILEFGGYKVLTAADGEAAIEAYTSQRERIDGVLLDVCMPRQDGGEVLRWIREQGGDVPVVVISGFAEQDARTRLESDRFTTFLQKPITARRLLDTLEDLLPKAN